MGVRIIEISLPMVERRRGGEYSCCGSCKNRFAHYVIVRARKCNIVRIKWEIALAFGFCVWYGSEQVGERAGGTNMPSDFS